MISIWKQKIAVSKQHDEQKEFSTWNPNIWNVVYSTCPNQFKDPLPTFTPLNTQPDSGLETLVGKEDV